MLRVIKDMYSKSNSDFFLLCGWFKTGGGYFTDSVVFLIADLELFLHEDPTCVLTFDGVTFILMLFVDDMVITGMSRNYLQRSLDL